MHPILRASVLLALAAPFAALADTPPDLAALRSEVDALRREYEARLDALEARLRQAEARSPVGPASTPRADRPAPLDATAPAKAVEPSPPLAAAPGAGAPGNAFNPSLSLILSGLYTRTSRDPAGYSITGIPLPPDAEIGPGTRGLSLAESELGIAASIDPWLQGEAHIALHPDDSISVEEAFVQTTSLGHGLSAKAGRFLSNIGYLNPQHAHTWDFVDGPLVYQALLGTQYGDDGVQATWLAPLDQFVEIGAELGRGRGYPGSGTGRNGAGMTALFAHTGGDIGESHSWRAGLSMLNAKADDQILIARDPGGTATESRFTGSTRVWIVDSVWKWAPNGNSTRTNFKLQGEYLLSTRRGRWVDDAASVALTHRAQQSGWYLQAVYQFVPRWRVGLRTERLHVGTSDGAGDPFPSAAGRYHPSRNALMVDFSPSEFSRIRLQLARDRAREGAADQQVFLQYQMSLGAHGAHGY